MIVRVYLLDPGPDAFAVAASLHESLAGAREEQPGGREIRLHATPERPREALRQAVATLDRYQPGWHDLVYLQRVA
jgi:hypothetical protein